MRTDHLRKYDDDAFVSDADLIGFDSPRDIVTDPRLSVAHKRQLLAYWGSDIHAATGSAALRSCAFGPTVTIDEIKADLVALDEIIDLPSIGQQGNQPVQAK